MASHLSWAQTDDRTARTAPARARFMARFEREVDPQNLLAPAERARRAEQAMKAHMAKLFVEAPCERSELRIGILLAALAEDRDPCSLRSLSSGYALLRWGASPLLAPYPLGSQLLVLKSREVGWGWKDRGSGLRCRRRSSGREHICDKPIRLVCPKSVEGGGDRLGGVHGDDT